MDYLIGLKEILEKIEANEEGKYFNHNEVRAYARCFLAVAKAESREAHIALLTAMAARGLAHYDRSFLAKQLVKLLETEMEALHHATLDEF